MALISNTNRRRSKFTRGEKCIFTHLVVTLALLIALLVVYFVHLLMVNHTGTQAYISYLRDLERLDTEKTAYHLPIGVVYVQPNTLMCNSLLIRHRWSLAPAQCVVARAEPDLSDLLRSWRITYRADLLSDRKGSFTCLILPALPTLTTAEKKRRNKLSRNYIETTVKRSIAHPHFDSDDFRNNIGLFEHDETLPIYSFSYPSSMTLTDNPMGANENDLEMIGWEDSWYKPEGELVHNSVRHLNLETCSIYTTPITELRHYEYCFTLKARRDVPIAAGAVLAINSTFVGFFSWGDSQGRGTPLIILDIMHFKDWIRHIISI